jgi:hypothetical protein
VPPDQYAQAAQGALGKLSPEERAEFLKTLQERAAARGVTLPGKVAPDPKDLGRCSPIYMRSRGSSGTSSAVASLRSKRKSREIPAGGR